MRKILICMTNLGTGGAEKVLIDILKNINQEKYKITVLLIFFEGVYLKYIPKGIEVKYIFKVKNNFIKKIIYKLLKYSTLSLLYKKYISNKYDIEIAFIEGLPNKLLSNSNKVTKKIAWVHTDLYDNHWTNAFYRSNKEEDLAFSAFEKIVFVSNNSKINFERLYNIKDEKLIVVYNPINSLEILKRSEEHNVIFDEFTICSVGRLKYEKGYDMLIRAHSKLINEGYKHKLVLIGEGIDRNELEKLIRDLKVKESVQLLGFIDNPYPFVKAANLFVCSSRTEGYSLAVAEAIVLGKPIISTRCTGPVELLENGKYGLLIEGSVVEIYNGIKLMLDNKENLKKFARLSEERSNFFNIDKTIEGIENILDKL